MKMNAVICTGRDSTASTSRPKMLSIQPPKYPITRPMAAPATVPTRVASGATMRMLCAPTSTRERTSSPRASVPNQWAPDGAVLMLSRFWASGLKGAK